MYSFQSRIRYSEVDQNCLLTLDKLIDYFQDCCIFHSESAGLGMEASVEKNCGWMLTGWQIVIDRMPRLMEEVTVSTWPYAFRSCNGWRNFLMQDSRGQSVATADSQWVFVDMQKGRPSVVPEDHLSAYTLEKKMELPGESGRIRVPKDCQERPSFPVRQDHIDTNHHVNNGQYVKMALAGLPGDLNIHNMRAEYRRQAKLGDEIFPRVKQEDGVWITSLDNEEQKPYAVIEIR